MKDKRTFSVRVDSRGFCADGDAASAVEVEMFEAYMDSVQRIMVASARAHTIRITVEISEGIEDAAELKAGEGATVDQGEKLQWLVL